MSTGKDEKIKRSGLKQVLVYIIVAILVGVIAYEGYNIYEEEHERNLAVQEYDDIASKAVSVSPEKLGSIAEVVTKLFNDGDRYRKIIQSLRDENIFNIGKIVLPICLNQ